MGKHIQAIETGDVFPRGRQGLVPSELADYARKTKVLGQGGVRRYHGYFTRTGVLVSGCGDSPLRGGNIMKNEERQPKHSSFFIFH